MHLQCTIAEAIRHDLTWRALHLCLSLSKHHTLTIRFATNSEQWPAWFDWLTMAQATQLASCLQLTQLQEYRMLQTCAKADFAGSDAAEQAKGRQRLQSLAPFFEPDTPNIVQLYLTPSKALYPACAPRQVHLVLLDEPKPEHVAAMQDFASCFCFTSSSTPLPPHCIRLPIPVTQMPPAFACTANAAEHIVCIHEADKSQALAALCVPLAKQISVFDPYAQLASDRENSLAASIKPLFWQGQDDAFSVLPQQGLTVLADPIDASRHSSWLDELAARGLWPLHSFLPNAASPLVWQTETLALALAHYRAGSIPQFLQNACSYEQVAQLLVEQLPKPNLAAGADRQRKPVFNGLVLCRKQPTGYFDAEPGCQTVNGPTTDVTYALAHAWGLPPSQWLCQLHQEFAYWPTYFLNQTEHDEAWQPGNLLHLFANHSPDVLIGLNEYTDRLLKMRSFFAQKNIPVVGFLYESYTYQHLEEMLIQMAFSKAQPYDVLITNSQAAANAAKQLIKDYHDYLQQTHHVAIDYLPEFACIPYGIEHSAFQALHAGCCRNQLGIPQQALVLASNLPLSVVPHRDLLPLLTVFKKLLQPFPRLYWIMNGSAAASHSAKWCEALDIPRQQLVWIDHFCESDKKILLGAADVFVHLETRMPTLHGMPLLEAMSAGLPVVASDWPVHREIMRNGEHGYLIDTYRGDISASTLFYASIWQNASSHADTIYDQSEVVAVNPAQLHQRLVQLLSDEALRRGLGEQARRHVLQHFDVRKQATKITQQILEQIAMAQKMPFVAMKPAFVDDLNRRFAHYPDELFGLHRRFRLGTWTRTPLLREAISQRLAGTITREQQFLQAVSEALGPHVLPGEALLAKLPASLYSPEQAKIRLVRLLKFGFLEYAD